jgi:hypothetical protein
VLLLLIPSCDGPETENEEGTYYPGLIGAYYGDPDLMNIKYPERLYSLRQTWDEQTGHGSAWSGKYVGYIESPVSGDITFELRSSQK